MNRHQSPHPNAPAVFDSLNYREYLRELFAARRRSVPGFTLKPYLSAVGISSSGFLSNVVAGRKNLTPIQSTKLAQALRLNKAEASYFESLVAFTQSKTLEEKEEYYNRLVRMQKINFTVLDNKKLSLFSKWYYVVVREMLGFCRIGDDPTGIGALLDPSISDAEVREAIDYLARMGLVAKDTSGAYKQVDAAITTGDEVKSMHLASFQLHTMDLGKRALQRIPAEERDISVLTMTLSAGAFRMVKSEVQAFRKRIAKIALDDTHPQQVFQMNMQLFPITRASTESTPNHA